MFLTFQKIMATNNKQSTLKPEPVPSKQRQRENASLNYSQDRAVNIVTNRVPIPPAPPAPAPKK